MTSQVEFELIQLDPELESAPGSRWALGKCGELHLWCKLIREPEDGELRVAAGDRLRIELRLDVQGQPRTREVGTPPRIESAENKVTWVTGTVARHGLEILVDVVSLLPVELWLDSSIWALTEYPRYEPRVSDVITARGQLFAWV